jgi:hypothetical protein
MYIELERLSTNNNPKSEIITAGILIIGEARAEARAIAVQMTDPHTKATMLAVAQDYDKLAMRAEQRRRRSTKPLFGWSAPAAWLRRIEVQRAQQTQAKSRTVWRSAGARSHRGLHAPIGNILPPISDSERPSPSRFHPDQGPPQRQILGF